MVNDVLARAGMNDGRNKAIFNRTSVQPQLKITPTELTINNSIIVPRRQANLPELVPHPLFYDNPRHTMLLERMATDYLAGEKAMLLVGNQVQRLDEPCPVGLTSPLTTLELVYHPGCRKEQDL